MASQATLDRLCAEFDSPPEHIAAAVTLLEQRATPVFLARYRRFEIGNLPEERLLALAERLHALSELEQRRESILQQASERGRRTPELEETLQLIADHDVLDDYYQSMRPRRRSVAMQMEERGLMPLALAIQHRQFGDAATETLLPPVSARRKPAAPAAAADDAATDAGVATEAALPAAAAATEDVVAAAQVADEPVAETLAAETPVAEAPVAETLAAETLAAETLAAEAAEDVEAPAAVGRRVPDVRLAELAAPYLTEEHGISTPEQALEGALLILADRISHDPATRARFRDELRRGILRAKPVNPDGNHGTYQQFFDFAEPINRIPANRMLALRRAEREKILELQLTLAEGRHRKVLRDLHARDTVPGSALGDFYDLVFDHAAAQLQDLCGKDVRRRLKEKADREAMRTYSRNLRSQLLAPPLGSKKVLSLRSSGKAIWAALLAEDGSVAEHKTLPVDSDEQKQGALTLLVEMIRSQSPAAIALPHGRRQAGSERILGELKAALGESPLPMVVPVDEAASTIFATSSTGKKAIPGVEVGVRTAISLGRRLQDPLLELSHMEVRTLGLGHTLDDVHQGSLHRELTQVKSSCLAQVGIDLNTAPKELLELLPGLSSEQSQAIVAYRKQHGGFTNREALRHVPSIDEATFRNIAAFLRIQGGDEPLDATPVHPEDYAIARAVAVTKGLAPVELFGQNLREVDADAIAASCGGVDRGHVVPVLQLMHRGGGDGRGELMASANQGVHTIADLHADRELRGRVASLTEFGAFVDLGIGQDGLVHISQIPPHRLRDASQTLRVGEVIDVWVLGIDQQKNKISLSMFKPRHLAEGRLVTLGERMEQQQGRRPVRGRREPERDAAQSRRPGTGGGRPGFRRGPGEGGREGGAGGEAARDGGRSFGRGRPQGDDDRGPRRDRGARGASEQRVYTVEPAREAEEQRTHKGEVTSLASLRNLLSKRDDKKA